MPFQQALLRGPSAVASNRLAIDAQRSGHRTVAMSFAQMDQDLSIVHGGFPLSWYALFHSFLHE